MAIPIAIGRLRLPILDVLLLFLIVPIHVASASDVRIGGTGSAYGPMKRMAEAFSNVNPGQRVEVLKPLGSFGGIRALADGGAEIAVANRKPNDTELKNVPMQWAHYGCSPFVIAVHRNLGVTAVTSAQLASMYSENPRFPDGRRARPVLRLTDATENRLVSAIDPAVAAALQAANQRAGMINASNDIEAADLIERTVNGFGPSSLAVIESERRPLVAVAIDGKVPTPSALENKSYPWRKDMYIMVRDNASPAARRFIAFVMSGEGRAVLHATGHSTRCP